jgi:SET domain
MFHRPQSLRFKNPTFPDGTSDDSDASSGSGRPQSRKSLSPPVKEKVKGSKPLNHGLFIPYRIAIPLFLLITSWSFSGFMGFNHLFTGFHWGPKSRHRTFLHSHNPNTINSLRGVHGLANVDPYQCRWYLAESAIPHSGLGIFTGIGLHKDDMIGYPDICIFVSDPPDHWTHLRSHTFGRGTFFGQYEGKQSRAACEGLITTVNTVPDALVNMEMVSPVLPTHAGVHRATSPGAGAITHHFGIHGKALDIITAGSEITLNYGDWDFDEDDPQYDTKPFRDVAWLQQHGWCIDHIEVGVSTIPHAGRGAFARTPISRGAVVAPAPLQVFRDRKVFQRTQPEQLFVNYCLQPADSPMLVFPYGQGVNLINHSSKRPNVEWRWSTHDNHLHHSQWFDLSYDEFWNLVTPGSIILEVVALRDIQPGEEILINYGTSWEESWNEHVKNWIPPANATSYVYPVEMDETGIVRTMKEQETDPYPANLMTMCLTSDFERAENNHIEWEEPTDFAWSEGMVYCHVLDRKYNRKIADYQYTVSLIFSLDPVKFVYDPTIPRKDLFIDLNVPRRAIRFMEVPYMDDEHLSNAFRHPLELPNHLIPESWKFTNGTAASI